MEGFCFQIAVHVTKIINSVNLSDELRSEWIRDITKHCNLAHESHLDNGKYPINFSKCGNYSRLIDHSQAKIKSKMPDASENFIDSENRYSEFILTALRFSQQNYQIHKPFSPDWVEQELTKIGI